MFLTILLRVWLLEAKENLDHMDEDPDQHYRGEVPVVALVERREEGKTNTDVSPPLPVVYRSGVSQDIITMYLWDPYSKLSGPLSPR